MAGLRVLVSGMGGELGSRIASLLEEQTWVGSLAGIDADPPRRRLRRAVFHRIAPGQHDRIGELVTALDPHLLVHVAVWEPHARAAPDTARRLTDDASRALFGAAAECPSLESVVVRSGIEVYGRRRRSATRPDEAVAADPTSEFGRMLAALEAAAGELGERCGVTVGCLRLAPVLGPHAPSPLGRLLRMPAVPFSALADPPFAVVHQHDAARAFVAASRLRLVGPVNVVAPGAITALQAIRSGRRLPVPVIGPDWTIARALGYACGAPIPDHVAELLHRGRLADGSHAGDAIGWAPEHTTEAVIDQLYAWPGIVRVPARRQVA